MPNSAPAVAFDSSGLVQGLRGPGGVLADMRPLKVRASQILVPASASSGSAGQWSSPNNGTLQQLSGQTVNGRPIIRLINTLNGGNTITIRKKLSLAYSGIGGPKIELPLRVPSAYSGGSIQVVLSSDSPADPPSSNGTNYQTITLNNVVYNPRGQWQVVGLDPTAYTVATDSYTATVAASIMTVSAITTGGVRENSLPTFTGVIGTPKIVRQLSGTFEGIGTYLLDTPQTASGSLSVTASATFNSFDVVNNPHWTLTGSPNTRAPLMLALSVYFGSQGEYIDFTDIGVGGGSVPFVILGFDGAAADPSHIEYVLPILDRYGIKAVFSMQGQQLTSEADYTARAQMIAARGHDYSCEGMNHTNYGANSTNAALLTGDIATALANYASIGLPSGPGTPPTTIFTAPNNTLYAYDNANGYNGLQTLASMGYKLVRSGNRIMCPMSSLVNNTTIGFGPLPGDLLTQYQLISYLDALERHGECGWVNFHTLVTGSASGTQTNVFDFEAFCAEIALRVAQGRLLAGNGTQFLAAIQNSVIWPTPSTG